MTEESRLIKKYSNRRLYDTRASAYISLADVKEMVLNHEAFRIVDFKTGEDLTRCTLLQIILDEESGSTPMLSSNALSHLIRFYGNAMQGVMGQFLANNLTTISQMQARMQDPARQPDAEADASHQAMWAQLLHFQEPALQGMMGSYLEQSKRMFQQIREQVKN